MAVSSDLFRKVMGLFATGVTVVTMRRADGAPWGLTVNAFTSVSLTPPLVLVCVGHSSDSFQAISESTHFAVNYLAEEQQDVSRRFATKDLDRFAGVPYRDGPHGSPLLEGTLGFVECRITASHPHGDHTIYIGEALEAQVAADGRPLLFFRSAYARMEKP